MLYDMVLHRLQSALENRGELKWGIFFFFFIYLSNFPNIPTGDKLQVWWILDWD